MGENNRKRGVNWGSLIGWLIFILVIAGGPLSGLLRRLSGGTLALPTNLLPFLIGGLVVLSVVVSAVRAMGRSVRSSGDVRLPTNTAPPRPLNPPPPRSAGPARPPIPSSPRVFTLPPSSREPRLPQPPQFEPLINPTILALGIVGLVVLGGIAFVILGLNLP
jgi:hypothetical protein